MLRVFRPTSRISSYRYFGGYQAKRGVFGISDQQVQNFKKDFIDKTGELSQENINSLVESGTKQAINAMNIIDEKLKEMDSESLTASVTFNAGLLQITFLSTSTRSRFDKNDSDN